METPFDMNSLN